MLRKLTLLAATALAAQASACLNDRDTLAQEARADLSVVRIATGRFERNPPLYYRMRLDRLAKEIPAQPDNLDLYDDAGVAADRIGLGDQAIEWMSRKRRRMEGSAKKAGSEAWYRYHANLGTFLIHRWLKEGGKPSRLAEAREARNEIAEALRIKPDAHFGRERVQLAAMDWILEVRQKPKSDAFLVDFLVPRVESRRYYHDTPSPDIDAALKGLLGLVALGNAWESFDIFAATNALLLARSDHSLARLAELRAEELAKAGKKSLQKAVGKDVYRHVPDWAQMGDLLAREEVDRQYRELRREADQWHAKRTAYMEERLKAGRHPDTDPTFWHGYREIPPPSLEPGAVASAWNRLTIFRQPAAAVALLAVVSILLLLILDRYRKKATARHDAAFKQHL